MNVYSCESIKDGSDMDTSSGSEGFGVSLNSYNSVAHTATSADNHHAIVIDCDFDSKSESAFYTAPNSPTNIEEELGKTDEIEELQQEHDGLVKQIEQKEAHITHVRQKLKGKKEVNEALCIKALRDEMSNSIKRNFQSTFTSTSSSTVPLLKKTKQFVPMEKSSKGNKRVTELYERGIKQFREEKKEYEAAEGETVESTSSGYKRVCTQKELLEFQNQSFKVVDQLPSITEQSALEKSQKNLYSYYITVMEKRLTSNNPNFIQFPIIASLSIDHLRKIVIQSHVIGYANLGQLRIQLLDLKRHAEQNPLNIYQKANVLELVRRLQRHKDKPDSYIPTAPKAKNSNTPKTTNKLLLDPQFYGNPHLQYDCFKPYTDEAVNRAIFYFIPDNEKFNAAIRPEKKKIPPFIRELLKKPGPHQESAAQLRTHIEAELNKILNNEVKPFLVSC
jgi:hypothetical protein